MSTTYMHISCKYAYTPCIETNFLHCFITTSSTLVDNLHNSAKIDYLRLSRGFSEAGWSCIVERGVQWNLLLVDTMVAAHHIATLPCSRQMFPTGVLFRLVLVLFTTFLLTVELQNKEYVYVICICIWKRHVHVCMHNDLSLHTVHT